MIKTSLKHSVAIAMLAGASVAANAATTDLGTVSFDTPTTFSGVVQGSGLGINDIFTFSLAQDNVSSGYSVVNVPLSFSGGEWNTALATMTLVSNVDGIVGNADDQVLASAIWDQGNSSDTLMLAYDQSLNGSAYINITGVTNGGDGGIYSGAIAAAVPEPETYAMLLAGLGLMGAVVRRRGMRK